MEAHSQVSEIERQRSVFEAQIRQTFGQVVYSHKTHEKCADILLARLSKVKIWQLVLSAVVTGGLVTTLVTNNVLATVLSAIVSAGLFVLNAVVKNFEFGEQAEKHRQTASDLWLIREQLLSLITDVRGNLLTIEVARQRRDELAEKLHEAYSSGPSTNSKAYEKARRALQVNEEMTFTSDEIDRFLPKELHWPIS